MSSKSTPATAHVVSVSKGGGDTESEDAAAVRTEAMPVRGALSDGATEAAYAGQWARILAEGVVETDLTVDSIEAALPHWRTEWQTLVKGASAETPWYVQIKADEGAFAALAGLEVLPGGTWRALSVGDSCVFHLRDGQVQRSWPFESPDAFTTRPALLPSRSDQRVPPPATTTGVWQSEDVFLLATDAVAAWLLRTTPLAIAHLDEASIRESIMAARADETLRNDDATVLVLTVQADRGDARSKAVGQG